MKAIRVERTGGPEVMQIVDLPDPQPKANEAVVKVAVAGVNSIDAHFRDGSYKPILLNGGKYACKVGLENDIRFSGTGVPERHRKISLGTALRLPERCLSCWK